MPRCSCDPRSRMTASTAEAPLLGQRIPVAAFSRGAGVLGIAPPTPKSNASMRPQPKRPSKTMQAPIAATHGRPVQYSQDHAYGQEAPTPPPFPPPSPRGRGLVEPYRPLGPLPPRTVRAVARLGPHPVADGHLVDVAALAAPPCGLAAYGLHAGRLQALVHARVPHRRYVGMRGGQVVVAGEHLASRAVRAARVCLALTRSARYDAGPLVAIPALSPDALVGVGDHVGRLQIAVAPPIPLSQKLGTPAREVFEHPRFLGSSSLKSSLSTYS